MSRKLIVTIVALAVFVLLIGLLFPTLITSTNERAVTGLQLDEGETQAITGGLDATAVETTNSEATIRLTDTETQESINATISEGATETLTFSINEETVDVTVEESTNSEVTLSPVEYARTYGWSDGAKTFIGEIGIIFAILAFLMVAAILAAVMRI